ncbi:MAG: addiction module antidote protein family [Rhizobium sp.]|nr:addiction module antidote protein family [Rhizobium sp.]
MANVEISVPKLLKDWIDGQANGGRYADAGDYIRDLIRRDQEESTKIANMQRMIDDSIASGISDESMDDILVALHAGA